MEIDTFIRVYGFVLYLIGMVSGFYLSRWVSK